MFCADCRYEPKTPGEFPYPYDAKQATHKGEPYLQGIFPENGEWRLNGQQVCIIMKQDHRFWIVDVMHDRNDPQQRRGEDVGPYLTVREALCYIALMQ